MLFVNLLGDVAPVDNCVELLARFELVGIALQLDGGDVGAEPLVVGLIFINPLLKLLRILHILQLILRRVLLRKL